MVVDGPATDCYAALGAIHGTWRPVPGRFRTSSPPRRTTSTARCTRASAPTGPHGRVLIRTEEMHRSAEYGIAADFRFPQSGRGSAAARAEQLDWLRRVLDWEPDAADPAQFLESLRCDLAEGQIQVFADGRQVVLPAGATPVDLAYELGNDRGDHCLAARINGRLARSARSWTRATWWRSSPRTTATTASRPVWHRAAPPGLARLRQVAARADADQQVVRRTHRAGHHDQRQGPPRSGHHRARPPPAQPGPRQ
ncbi:TGS domain-containing protein [Micromonospora sp. M12]